MRTFNAIRTFVAGIIFSVIFPEVLFRSVRERRERMDRLRNPEKWRGR